MSTASRVWGVSALVQAVGDTLSARYGMVVVRGEISGFTRAASGHGYFTLKDELGQGSLRCAMFRRALSQVDFPVSEGQLVEARGQLSVYEARGELQLVVDGLQRAGAGALYEQFLRLKARLEAAGLFDEGRKREIPAFPRRVAVVTSLAAAALRDVVTALRRRAPHVEVLIVPCAVQGAEAPPQIVDALAGAAWLHRQGQVQGQGLDAVILCRGGGSLEDLWAFNDERVVRAVVACPVPVVCGVGHETDVTLADLAADLRAPTPTAAAELVAQSRDEALVDLDTWAATLRWRLRQRLDQHAQRLDQLGMRLSRPGQVLHVHRQRMGSLEARLHASLRERVVSMRHSLAPWSPRLDRALAQRLAWARQQQAHLGQRLEALNPQRVLERGYAWVSQADGAPLTRASQAQTGQKLGIQLADGRLQVEVDGIESQD
ncbi:MAG TPA: exodeoxyribonuclease VII large subunit [Aquabacterium sp.]|uniref:exodeoxyribonuclease VII large subunit n=1 Tax=Aquabacterium sp. TaxID=1872578 RepID=UPI002E2EE29E|nr:exodeoxyribonuclease VII large subunit [Aquabacterium sp.]HEX5374377.1 exodeoxyribonuclease VII large subunit [Aquabacterium sp.]